jgi:hypothetical protein
LAYATIEWFRKYDEIFSRIYTLRYRAMAQFPEGKNAAAPFNKLQSICVELQDELRHWIMLSQVESDSNKWTDQAKFREHQAKIENCERFIWAFGKEDPLSPRLKEIIEHIEQICRPQICGAKDSKTE